MIYKLVAAATLLVSSAEALKVNGIGMTRRAAIAKAASLAVPLVSFPALAAEGLDQNGQKLNIYELNKATDAEIYKRADEGTLNAARAIIRAETDLLVDGSSATCAELDELIRVDREAVAFEQDKLGARFDKQKEKKSVQATEEELQAQITKLKKIRKKKGCSTSGAKLQQPTDFEVYKRADEGRLTTARAIDRAKAGKLVDGSGASCTELERIIEIDQKAVKFEKEKLDALGSKADPNELQAVADAEKAIEVQIEKLAGLRATKKC